ncbi:NPCBM/NEW2 domain-containing protein [Lacunimicrobium album]
MKKLLPLLLVAFACNITIAQSVRDERLQSAAAQKILTKWQSDADRSQKRYLHVFAWTPADRPLPENHEERLNRILKHIQAFYANEMDRHGFGHLTINMQRTGEGKVLIHSVKGQKPYADYDKPSGNEIRKECMGVLTAQGLDPDQETMIIFCNLAEWDPKALTFSHKSPYYGGGTAASGVCWQLDSPELDIPNIKLKQPKIRDGEYGNISLGRHNSIFIGGMAHELGHGLGLPHCSPRPDEKVRGQPIMGLGNQTYGEEMRGEGQGAFLSFAHALRLATHPQFSGVSKQLDVRPKVEASLKSIDVDGKAIRVKGNVKGEPPVYGVVAYFDPEGNSDYNATTMTAIPDAAGDFEFASDALAKGKLGELRIKPLHCNGLVSDSPELRLMYRVSPDGVPDISTAQIRLELAPFLEAYSGRDQEKTKRLADRISSKQGAAIAKHLMSLSAPTKTPAEAGGSTKSAPLTSFKPNTVEVGWMRGTFDRLPDNSVLLESAGQIFERGLYAHAPARHVYSLGGKWKSLTGKAGIADGHTGSAQFIVKGDNKTLWQSDVVKAGQLVEFQVDLSGVQELELSVGPTPDGTRDDWGLWLAPELHAE